MHIYACEIILYVRDAEGGRVLNREERNKTVFSSFFCSFTLEHAGVLVVLLIVT